MILKIYLIFIGLNALLIAVGFIWSGTVISKCKDYKIAENYKRIEALDLLREGKLKQADSISKEADILYEKSEKILITLPKFLRSSTP